MNKQECTACLREMCSIHATQTIPHEEWESELSELLDASVGLTAASKTLRLTLHVFINKTRTAAYEKGQQDAFEGRVQNMKTITIHETLDVPEPLREHFRKEGYEKGVTDTLEVVEKKKGWCKNVDEIYEAIARLLK